VSDAVGAGGALLVDKPAGPTSHDIVAHVRRALGRGARVGHAGTLDPFATGLLIVLWGRSTRLAPYLTGLDKRYRAVAQLGARSDTGDRDGVLEPVPGATSPSREVLAELAGRLVGELEQVPPTASAIHIDGRRAHELHRAGETVVMPTRSVRVDEFALEEYDEAAGRATLSVHCSKGTYVRALVRDLGELAGCGAYCEALRRTASGPLEITDAADLASIEADPTGGLWALSPAAALAHLPARELDEREQVAVGHGQPLEAHGEVGATRCLVDGRLVCVAEPASGVLRPKVVLEPAA
jgi:tRNA pseudouridine55 synthase